jgi:hypothetical protein
MNTMIAHKAWSGQTLLDSLARGTDAARTAACPTRVSKTKPTKVHNYFGRLNYTASM